MCYQDRLFGFGGDLYFFDNNTIASNMQNPTFCGQLFFNVFTGCDLISSFFNCLKLGWQRIYIHFYTVRVRFHAFCVFYDVTNNYSVHLISEKGNNGSE